MTYRIMFQVRREDHPGKVGIGDYIVEAYSPSAARLAAILQAEADGYQVCAPICFVPEIES